jgi:predicted dithiol-disulfide oxidoreductase (DUF899 family)
MVNNVTQKGPTPTVGTREQWVAARKALLKREKALTRERDAVSAMRRALPMVIVEKNYVFDGPGGRKSLTDLFNGRGQLIIYHFMYDPQWDAGCTSCSFVSDSFGGTLPHLAAKDIAFAAVSRAPIEKILAYKKRMGWPFPWYSSFNNDFNYDFHVTLDPKRGSTEYNFEPVKDLIARDLLSDENGEMPGISVFYRNRDGVYHTYSAYQRGVDQLIESYTLIDLTPRGRDEDDRIMGGWIRRHDEYDT